MKDTSGAQVLGRTSLKRLGIVMVPTVVAAGALTVLMANGAIAVSFAISGQTAQMTVGQLQGKGFAQYGGIDKEANGTEVPVAVSAFKTATISNGLCQSVATNLGPLGTYTLTLKASGGSASDLIIDLQTLKASEADFNNIDIGIDASQINTSAQSAQGSAGAFGQAADSATLTNIQQVSNATSAGTFDLQGMSLGISKSATGCIPAS
ncbi:MAG TPA: DUF6230 family protein [Actinospica sp.]|jgi:hypothetical protein|nr:DUF6230 family protein [Actinospica sp.]